MARFAYAFTLTDDATEAFNRLDAVAREARRRVVERHDDGCHYCGNPDPGERCRYCDTAHHTTPVPWLRDDVEELRAKGRR